MPLDSGDVAFCSNRKEVVFYSRRMRKIWAVDWDRNTTASTSTQNKYFFPLSELGVVQVVHFMCIPEKSAFQVLGVKADQTRVLLTFRGGESFYASRRLHSVVPVESSTRMIHYTVNGNIITTVCSNMYNDGGAKSFIITYIDGPHFKILRDGQTSNFSSQISATSLLGVTSSKTHSVEFISPIQIPVITPQKKYPNQVGTVIDLDVATGNNIGPIINVTATDSAGAVSTLVKVKGRVNIVREMIVDPTLFVQWKREYHVRMVANSVPLPNSLRPFIDALGKLPVTISPSCGARYANNPFPAIHAAVEIDAADVAVVTRTIDPSGSPFNTHYNVDLLTGNGSTGVNTCQFVSSPSLYRASFTFDTLVATSLGKIVTMAVSPVFDNARPPTNDTSNKFIRLVSFTRSPSSNSFMNTAEATVHAWESKLLGNYSIVNDGDKHAVIIGTYINTPGICVAKWDMASNLSTIPCMQSSVLFPFVVNSANEPRLPLINWLKCWPKAVNVVTCYLDTEDSIKSIFDLTLSNFTSPFTDPIVSIVRLFDIEVPAGFEFFKVERGKDHYGFEARRQGALAATSSSVGSMFAQCSQIIAIYKPAKQKELYTAVPCDKTFSDFPIEFSIENYDSKDYITYKFNQYDRVITAQSGALVSINYVAELGPATLNITSSLDPTAVKVNFFGINSALSTPAPGQFLPSLTTLLDDYVYAVATPITPTGTTTTGTTPSSSTSSPSIFSSPLLYIGVVGGIGMIFVMVYLYHCCKQKLANRVSKPDYRRSENEQIDGKYSGPKGKNGKNFEYDDVDARLIFM
jgi:hypothetical protein